MSIIHRSRRAAFGIAAFLAGVLVAPLAVTAEEQILAAPPAAPAWNDTSGYGSVEASRAAVSALLTGGTAWDAASGFGAVEVSRSEASAMLAPTTNTIQVSADVRWAPARMLEADAGSGRGSLRAADLAAARAWDETSGYGAVETSRADQ